MLSLVFYCKSLNLIFPLRFRRSPASGAFFGFMSCTLTLGSSIWLLFSFSWPCSFCCCLSRLASLRRTVRRPPSHPFSDEIVQPTVSPAALRFCCSVEARGSGSFFECMVRFLIPKVTRPPLNSSDRPGSHYGRVEINQMFCPFGFFFGFRSVP
jgi:hypothetical protein